SFQSCAHGAGRRMSRTQAARTYTSRDLVEQTRGVLCRKDKGVVDEIPAAYKSIDEVMENQHDLVDTVHTLKQVICVKGRNSGSRAGSSMEIAACFCAPRARYPS